MASEYEDTPTVSYWEEKRETYLGPYRDIASSDTHLESLEEYKENRRGLMGGASSALNHAFRQIAAGLDELGVPNILAAKRLTEAALEVGDLGAYNGYTKELGTYANLRNLEIENWFLGESVTSSVSEILRLTEVLWRNEKKCAKRDDQCRFSLLFSYALAPVVYEGVEQARGYLDSLVNVYFPGITFDEKLSEDKDLSKSLAALLLGYLSEGDSNRVKEFVEVVHRRFTRWAGIGEDSEWCEDITVMDHVMLSRLHAMISGSNAEPIEIVRKIRGY